MDRMDHAALKSTLRQKSTAQLLEIWTANDRKEWPQEAFVIIRGELRRRGAKLPRQMDLEQRLVADRDYSGDVGVTFFPVTPAKLAVMSLLTWGLYEIAWFYRNWKFLKDKRGFDVLPWARGLFGPVFSFSLFRVFKEYARQHDVALTFNPTGLALAYIGLLALYRLPSPFDLLSSFTFIPLMVAQRGINVLNARLYPDIKPSGRFSGWNIFGIVVGGLLWLLVIAGLIFPEASTATP